MASNTHILAIPYPLQGHINPMTQLCFRLSAKGIRVTLVTTVSISKSLERQPQQASNLINLETVPDSTIDADHESLDVYEMSIRSFRASITNGLPSIVEKYSNSGNPLSAIVYDSVIPWILDIAHGKGLKGAALFTQPCSVCAVYYHVHKGSLEIPPDDGYQISLPGMPVMGVKDLPSYVNDVSSYPSLSRFMVGQFSTFEKADWRLFNTFDELEHEILKWMANMYSIRAIGPTIPSMYADKRLQGNYNYGLSLFKPKSESWMKWLNEKEDRSVIYVSFGSLSDLTEKQMEEVAYGLIDSKCDFLWVVRDTEQRKLPQDFTPRLMQKGLIVNWCVQLEVISHRAVGCFLTHCGWNSTLETIMMGVPMVVMPQWGDQTTNAKMIVDVWKIGVGVKVDANGIVAREEVAARVNEVLHGVRSDEIRRNASKWRDLAIKSMSEGGSSDMNIAEFAREVMSI
ncbi:hypothetical protein ACS0TY_025813 [Phlomoides rotata]